MVWDFLHHIVTTLGLNGMSSDESEKDGDRTVDYFICKQDWCHPYLTCLLEFVDEDRNVTNAYGNKQAGNPLRNQIRIGGKLSTRAALAGLPKNWYEEDWLANLTPRQLYDLQAKSISELKEITRDRRGALTAESQPIPRSNKSRRR